MASRPEDRRRPVRALRRRRPPRLQAGRAALAAQPAARDFVADAYAHCKFIGYTGDAAPLFEAAGLGGLTDDGFISLDEHSAADFIARCASCGSGPARPASRRGSARRRHPPARLKRRKNH